jgi:hypothetical protein
VLVGATAVVFLLVAGGRITGRFGDSDEGINGAVWSYNALSLRDHGVLASKLGGKRLDGTLYASHPPLIVVETAAAQAVGGNRPWSSRAPAWVGSLAALALLYYLCRDAGFDRLVAAGAVALTGLTPMLVAYGPMLDTPVTELPFGVAVLIAWYRDWRGDRPVPWWLAGGLALVASLAGWQAALLCMMCGLALAVLGWRRKGRSIWAALPYLIGAAIGVALALGWAYWVYGSFHVLSQKYLGRTGSSNGVGLGDMVSFQVPWIFALLALSVVGLFACVVALRDQRLRPLAAMALASVAVYAVIFRQAAAGHQYWNYWVLLPAAVGWAYALDSLTREVRNSTRSPWAPVAVVGVIVIAVGSFNLLRTNKAAAEIDTGHRAANLVADTRFPAGQHDLTYVGEPYRPDAWITYATPFEPTPLTSASQLDELARTRPDDLVLVLGNCPDGSRPSSFCVQATSAAETAAHGSGATGTAVPLPVPARLMPARDLAAALPHGSG